jgi:LmbE family N-acetylglucosaminyl deacetylase
MEKKRVLVVLAHPDDPEFFCGGTVARWCAEGHEVVYCLLTKGERGSDDGSVVPAELAAKRQQEQQRAAEILGVRQVIFLDYPDGMLAPSLEVRRDIVRTIRRIRPQVIVTCDPTNYFPSDRYINHPDHRAAGQATLDAVFPAAGSALYFPELTRDEGLQPHKISRVYVAAAQHPNTTVDVSATIERKLRAILAHQSQIRDPEGLEARVRERMLDPTSPPDSPRYIERFKRIDLQ